MSRYITPPPTTDNVFIKLNRVSLCRRYFFKQIIDIIYDS